MTNQAACGFALLVLLASSFATLADDLSSLCADRAAVERVYYSHRLGEKPPFEQALPPATLENLVRKDLRREPALKKSYGVEAASALLDVEVQRINSTTRAPEMLAEIKAALGNDPCGSLTASPNPSSSNACCVRNSTMTTRSTRRNAGKSEPRGGIR